MKVIFHVCDLDGRSSAAIVLQKYPNAELIPFDYGYNFPWNRFNNPNETVYMLDVSLQIHEMKLLSQRCNLIWIDHHKTIMDDAVRESFNPPGVRLIGWATCELTWDYLFDPTKRPLAIHHIGRYDVWDHRGDPDIIGFQNGMKLYDTNPEDPIWVKLFRETGAIGDLTTQIISQGKTIQEYQRRENKIYCKVYSFETLLDGYRAVAINRGIANSQLFESEWDKNQHDIMIAFNLKKMRDDSYAWKISLYSDKPGIDVGAIASRYAKQYGTTGGGHAGASSFFAPVLPFLEESKYIV